jgi:serine/threonine protein kinase
MTTINLNQTWQLGAQIGEGGFGHIYAAQDGSEAVIKLVPKVPGASRELLFESVSGLPNIIPILDSGEWQDNYVLVMPRAEKSLRQHLDDTGGQLAVDDAVPILLDVAEALASLGQDIVHRDLKPENVLYYQGHWCLADFGIARYAEASTAPDTRKYSMSPPYAAPEQWRFDRVTPAADVYAFGVMAFELLQGQRPFLGFDAADLRERHLNQAPPSLTGCPPSVGSLVTECLYKPSQARPTAANIVRRLRTRQHPPSPAAAKLQAVNQKIVGKQAEEGAKASAQKSAEQQRMDLLTVARHSLSQILDMLIPRVLEEAPAAKLLHESNTGVSLGNGVLVVDPVSSVSAGSLVNPSRRLPFDVIAYTTIVARKPRDRYGYEGCSHSLWFCDAHDAGVYRWYELAFMISPFVQQSSSLNPLASAPTHEDALEAFSMGLGVRQVAWEPLPFDQGDEEQFIERWLGWFAAAADGTLNHPAAMPENSGGRHR